MLGAAALLGAGCGGDGEDDPPRARPVPDPRTEAGLLTQAEAICRDVERAQRRYSDRIDALGPGSDLKRAAPIIEGALEQSRKGLARLRALRAPSEDRPAFSAFLAAAERLVDAHAELAEAARAGDEAAGRKVAARSDALSAEQARLAREYGLIDCEDVF